MRTSLLLLLVFANCHSTTSSRPAASGIDYADFDRMEFNRLAVRENLPIYWIADRDSDRAIDPDEVASLLFYPNQERWVENGAFTPAFERAFARISEPKIRRRVVELVRALAGEPEEH